MQKTRMWIKYSKLHKANFDSSISATDVFPTELQFTFTNRKVRIFEQYVGTIYIIYNYAYVGYHRLIQCCKMSGI